MKAKKFFFIVLSVLIAVGMLAGTVLADDSVMMRRNISKTPEGETEDAGIGFMAFAVPAQHSDGTLVTAEEPLEYTIELGEDLTETVLTATYAKPLIAVYVDDIHHELEETSLPEMVNAPSSGLGFGMREAFIGHSLDDGETWKTTNVSEAADLSSFTLKNGEEYPGDTYAGVMAVAGNRVIAAWLSRYCDGGSPLYTLVGVDDVPYDDDLYVEYMKETYGKSDLYLRDIWGVAGSQKSIDYTLEGFPEVGEVPFGCVWTARGTLVETTNDLGETIHDMVWTKAERLTSGVRDPNRLEVDAVPGAGFVITWQEDPDGLRPGLGLGPGEGWSGAIVHAKTDIWYSYLDWEDFGKVDVDGDLKTYAITDTLDIEDYFNTYIEGVEDPILSEKPKPAISMATPVRLTDNNMCKYLDSTKTTGDDYCHSEIDTVTGVISYTYEYPAPATELCAELYTWDTPDDDPSTTVDVCKAMDGRLMNGRVGSSRPRISLQPYTKADGSTSAWFLMAYEETKGMGTYLRPVEEDDGGSSGGGSGQGVDEGDPVEIGKDIWYHTFDMFHPEVVQHGGMLNQPSDYNPEFPEDSTDPEMIDTTTGLLYLPDELGNKVYQTEISRRFSMIAQPVAAIGDSRTSAFLLYKSGILKQGGPADIFARRVVVPSTFDPKVDNPYLYENMACAEWIYPTSAATNPDGSTANPNYKQGLCKTPAINLSAVYTFNDAVADNADAVMCNTSIDRLDCVDDYPWDPTEEEIDTFPKVYEWSQTVDNLDDQSWENPFDVAKGHRGFIDGDFVMVLYAWSPNWKANSVGNDKYNLYIRRSFDGGQTWTTTPATMGGAGMGTGEFETETDPSLCENYGVGGQEEDIITVCSVYGAGEFEQARNVSQLTGTKVTILDPRYTPTGGWKKLTVKDYVDGYLDTSDYDLVYTEMDGATTHELDSVRDASKYFIVYETGDNTTAAEGEPTPLDLFYSRATIYGDVYEWETVITDKYPDGELRWPWLEKNLDDLSGEAALTANPSGHFFYADWSQWREDELGNVFDSDVWFRRLFYNSWEAAAPIASIISSVPTTVPLDGEVTLVASAKDNDQLGDGDEIVLYEWSVDGVVVEDQTGKAFNAPARTLSEGWHGFSVRAKDNEGSWSRSVTVEIYIGTLLHYLHIPLVINQ